MPESPTESTPTLTQPEAAEEKAAKLYLDQKIQPITSASFAFRTFELAGIDEEDNFVFNTSFEAPYTNPSFIANRFRHDLLTCAARLGGTASVTNEFLDKVHKGNVPHELHRFTLEIKVPKHTIMEYTETNS